MEIDEDGVFIVSCPTLLGCHSYGDTLDDAISNIREAIELYLEEKNDESMRRTRFIGFQNLEIQRAA